MKDKYRHGQVPASMDVKIDFADRWVHLHKSNAEPVIRIYAGAPSLDEADLLTKTIIQDVRSLI